MKIPSLGINIKFAISDIYSIEIINNIILILININKPIIYNIFKEGNFNSINRIALLVGIDKNGCININKCKVFLGEYFSNSKINLHKAINCNLNIAEKCSIITLFMPSHESICKI